MLNYTPQGIDAHRHVRALAGPLATLMRERGANPWDLSGFMGHKMPGQTETYAVTRRYPTATKPPHDIVDNISARLLEYAAGQDCLFLANQNQWF